MLRRLLDRHWTWCLLRRLFTQSQRAKALRPSGHRLTFASSSCFQARNVAIDIHFMLSVLTLILKAINGPSGGVLSFAVSLHYYGEPLLVL